MSKLKEVLSNVWAWVVGIGAILVGLFLWEKSKRKDAESKLEVADANKTDAVLNERKENLQKDLVKEQDALKTLEAEKDKAVEATKNESLNDVADFFNKNKG